jgi:hypothetical protein
VGYKTEDFGQREMGLYLWVWKDSGALAECAKRSATPRADES